MVVLVFALFVEFKLWRRLSLRRRMRQNFEKQPRRPQHEFREEGAYSGSRHGSAEPEISLQISQL